MLAPTDGLLTMVVMPYLESCVLSPIPESMRSWGVPIAPADRMTSRRARSVERAEATLYLYQLRYEYIYCPNKLTGRNVPGNLHCRKLRDSIYSGCLYQASHARTDQNVEAVPPANI